MGTVGIVPVLGVRRAPGGTRYTLSRSPGPADAVPCRAGDDQPCPTRGATIDTAAVSVRDLRTRLSHLDALEAESVFIMREVAAEFQAPVLLFSGGKDSIVMLRLAEKAFRPARFPFPLMHIDTGHNFPEVLDFRDRRVEQLGEQLIVASVQESIDKGRVKEEPGNPSRNRL